MWATEWSCWHLHIDNISTVSSFCHRFIRFVWRFCSNLNKCRKPENSKELTKHESLPCQEYCWCFLQFALRLTKLLLFCLWINRIRERTSAQTQNAILGKNVKSQNENIQSNPENYSECFTATQRKSLDPDFILVVNSEFQTSVKLENSERNRSIYHDSNITRYYKSLAQ
jgi:hypothetical protein